VAAVSVGKQDEINGFQSPAGKRKKPHGTRRQAGKEQRDQRQDAADEHLPAHGNIFFIRPFEQQIPEGVQRGGNEE